jgi:hypothetical protein
VEAAHERPCDASRYADGESSCIVSQLALSYPYTPSSYHYHAGMANWIPISLASTEAKISNAWHPKTANTTLSGLDLQNTTHYVLGYLCTSNGTQWKCGCRDSACTQSYWQVQSFKR